MSMDFGENIRRVKKVDGVLDCIVFKDGLPIEKIEESYDPEQISAVAEDLIRAAIRLSKELGIDETRDLILETPTRKLLIYPLEDAWIGVLTERDINLGLLRLVLESFEA